MDGAVAQAAPAGAAADAAALHGLPAAAPTRRRGRAVTGGAATGRGRSGRVRAGGRGRGRKRRRSPSPIVPAAEQPDVADESGHDTNSESVEGSAAEDLAAEAAADAQAAPQLPLRDQALLLLLNLGAAREKAELAMDEVAERLAREQGGQVYTDAEEWADAAVLALTERADFEAERDDIAVAMEESLEEAQARKAAEKPLQEKSAEELAQVFRTSCLLPALGRRFAAQSLLAPPLHAPLLELLQLEKKCIKWYDCRDCACWYFRALAASLLEQLGSIFCDDAAPGSCDDAAPGSCDQAVAAAAAAAGGAEADPPPAATAGAGPAVVGQKQQAQQAQPPDIGDDARQLLAALVDSEYERLARIVLLESRGNEEAPQLFLDAVPPDALPDEVDLCSDGEEVGRLGGTAAQRPPQQEQQQQQQQQGTADAPQEEPA